MIVLALASTFAAFAVSVFVFYANGMSDAPQQETQGKGWIIASWVVAAIFWLAWYFK